MQTTPYNPCVAGPTPAVKCDFDERLCRDYESYPCSEGYCLDGDIEENEGIPGNGIVADKTFDIDGVYRITQSVKFTNCVFKMRGAAQIALIPDSENLVKITFENCSFFGCEVMWQGIVIDAAAAPSLWFSFTGCEVEDAYIGLSLYEGPTYYYHIGQSEFRNNHIGISNARQTYLPLAASILDNIFTQTDELAEVPEEMEALDLPDYPVGHAGILLTNTAASVGVATGAPGHPNLFSCIMNGIVANDCVVSSFRNEFVDLHDDGRGIWADGGSLKVRWNNDVEMKENVINHHELGINIDFLIGNQPGHGNTWSSEVPGTTDCTGFAATTNPMDNPFDPLNSLFLVPEDDELPFLPPPAELDPNPTMGPNWFVHDDEVSLDYCDPESTNSIDLLPYEEDIIDETFPFSNAELWDAKRKLYYKLLLYPALRPAARRQRLFSIA